MDQNWIELNSRKDLSIYMSPARQRLMRELEIAGAPQTPKALSLRLGISPSSVQHHLGKLLELGVVKVDHTERINGITATYYVPTRVSVRIGLDREDCRNEREALAVQVVQTAVQGYFDTLTREPAPTGDDGDSFTNVVHLTPEDWTRLKGQIQGFLDAHAAPGPGTSPWQLALLAYRVEVDP